MSWRLGLVDDCLTEHVDLADISAALEADDCGLLLRVFISISCNSLSCSSAFLSSSARSGILLSLAPEALDAGLEWGETEAALGVLIELGVPRGWEVPKVRGFDTSFLGLTLFCCTGLETFSKNFQN